MSNISSSKTTEQENEILAHRFHMELFQKANFSLADKILTPNFVIHNPFLPSELTESPEGIKKFASGVADSCPGHQFTHHDTISKEDKVLIRWTFTGVAKRDFLGVPAGDKPITISGFDLFRISEDGKLAEMWQQWNIGSWP